jgi:hypothetical protein
VPRYSFIKLLSTTTACTSHGYSLSHAHHMLVAWSTPPSTPVSAPTPTPTHHIQIHNPHPHFPHFPLIHPFSCHFAPFGDMSMRTRTDETINLLLGSYEATTRGPGLASNAPPLSSQACTKQRIRDVIVLEVMWTDHGII